MADNKNYKELEHLLKRYVEELKELCHVCDITPERGFTKDKQVIKRTTELMITSSDFSTIHSIIHTGIKLIHKTKQALKEDSCPVQPCASSVCVPHINRVTRTEELDKHCKDITLIFRGIPTSSEDLREYLDIPKQLDKIFEDIGCVEHLDCKTCSEFKESCDWKLTEPLEMSDDVQMKYRMKLASGCYECRRTGLRVECSGDVELEYHMCDWESVSGDLHRGNLTPCGPLIDIRLISGELISVHLPHFLCLGGGNVEGVVKVLHIENSGVSFEKCELTRFHAKLLDHNFTAKGLLMKIGFSVNYHCETLIYQTDKTHLTLHVYLIPSDKNIMEAVEKEENRKMIISKPGPVRSLQMNDMYTLNTLRKGKKSKRLSEITPKELQLKYNCIKPKFFEVFINAPKEDFYLQVMSQKCEVVWDAPIRKGDYMQNASAVDGRKEFIGSSGKRSVREILLKYLDDLKSEDLKLFTWHLTEGDCEDKIPKSKLENKEMCDIVSCLIDRYQEDGAVRVTQLILKKMNQNHLAEHLQQETNKAP